MNNTLDEYVLLQNSILFRKNAGINIISSTGTNRHEKKQAIN